MFWITRSSKQKHEASDTFMTCAIEALEKRQLLSAGFIYELSGLGPHGLGATVEEYTPSGLGVASYSVGYYPAALVVSGSDLFNLMPQQYADLPPDSYNSGTIEEYASGGATVNYKFVSNLDAPVSMTISGTDIFVTLSGGIVSEYNTAGATANASLISGLNNPSSIAVAGSHVFVLSSAQDNATQEIGEYNLNGSTVNRTLISGLDTADTGLVADGADLYISTQSGISQYSTNGTLLNSTFSPNSGELSVAGGDIFVHELSSAATIVEYNPSGQLVDSYTSEYFSSYGLFAVAAAAPTTATSLQLFFLSEPDSISLGQPDVFFEGQDTAIGVEDENGDFAPNANGNVTLSIASGPAGAALLGTTTVTLVDGAAEFSTVAVNELGTYVITASSDIANPVSSDSVTVTSLADRKLSFMSQSTEYLTASDQVLPAISVDTEDLSGNAITNADEQVTLGLVGGPSGATLGGDTSEQTKGGIADFSNLSFSEVGAYTLMASKSASEESYVLPTLGNIDVVSAVPSVMLTDSASAVGGDQSITFSATVTTLIPGETPTGSVTFADPAGNVYAQVPVASNGTASFTTTFLKAGSFSLMANYSGDSLYLPAVSSPLSVLVNTSASAASLVMGKESIPSATIAGVDFRSRVPVVVSNGESNLKGTFTLRLYAQNADGASEATSLITSIAKRLSLKSNQKSDFVFPLKAFPTTLSAGNYKLIATLVDPLGSVATTTLPNLIQVITPLVQPTVSIKSSPPTTLKAGQSGSIVIAVLNQGNIAASNIAVTLSLLNADATVIKATNTDLKRSSIKPGKSFPLRLRFTIPPDAVVGNYTFTIAARWPPSPHHRFPAVYSMYCETSCCQATTGELKRGRS